MREDKDFKFTVNLSKVGYSDKESITKCLGKKNRQTYKTESLRFKQSILTTDDMTEYISNGYAFCAVFDTNEGKKIWTQDEKPRCIIPVYKDGYMNLSIKKDEYFIGSQTVCIDIDDTNYLTIPNYIDKLTYKPTFSYTSFSDRPGNRKFRLVYVMDRLLNRDEFRLVAGALHTQAEKDTQEPIGDFCGTRASQYMNGTRKDAEIYKYYYIYSTQDFQDLFHVVEERFKQTHTQTFDKDLLHDMANRSYNEVAYKYSKTYKYYFQTDIEFKENEKYRLVENDFIYLYFRWNGGRIVKFKDGEHRRKKLLSYAKLRRLIKPTITPSELLYNIYIDLNRFFDNTDEAITLKTLTYKVNQAFSLTIDEIKQEYDSMVKYAEKNKGRKTRKFIINTKILSKFENLNGIIGEGKKEYNYNIIDKLYNPNKSVKENMEIINNAGYSFCKKTIYNYCKDRGIKVKHSDKELTELINPEQSIRKNQERLREQGVKVSKDRITRLIKELELQNKDNSKQKATLDPVLTELENYTSTTPPSNDKFNISIMLNVPSDEFNEQENMISNNAHLIDEFLIGLAKENKQEHYEDFEKFEIEVPSFSQFNLFPQ